MAVQKPADRVTGEGAPAARQEEVQSPAMGRCDRGLLNFSVEACDYIPELTRTAPCFIDPVRFVRDGSLQLGSGLVHLLYGLTMSTPMMTTFTFPRFSAQCSTSRDSVIKPPGPAAFT